MLHSTLGRHAARAIRCGVMAELALKHWGLLVENIGKGDTAIFNPPMFPAGEQRGFGFHEAPRGTLSHWVRHQGRQDRQLPGGGAVDLERRPARREGPEGSLRGVA